MQIITDGSIQLNEFFFVIRRSFLGYGDTLFACQILSGEGVGSTFDFVDSSSSDDFTAMYTCPWTKVDDMVSAPYI